MSVKKIMNRTWYVVLGISITSIGLFSYLTGLWIFTLRAQYRESMLILPDQVPFLRTNWSTIGMEAIDEWVLVEGTELYYFSAYLENGVITVITIAEKTETPYHIVCRFFSNDGILLHVKTQGEVHYIPEDHGKRYTASFVHCKAPEGPTPYAVALISSEYSLPLVYVPIINVKEQKLLRNFTVCICPLRLGLDEVNAFVEMIELNRILGADRFIIYQYNTSLAITTILEYYKDQGFLDVIPWSLPLTLNATKNTIISNIHYFGQLAVLNDCIYRSKGASRFVVNQDIDEFIIPRKHEDWYRMIESIPPHFDSYMFRSTYFRTDWPDVNETFLSPEDRILANKYQSLTIVKQVREEKIFPKRIRSKYVVNPKCVHTAGIHEIYKYSKDFYCQTFLVDESVGLVHHYRDNEQRDNVTKTIDSRINAFKDKLLQSLRKVWTELNNIPAEIKEEDDDLL